MRYTFRDDASNVSAGWFDQLWLPRTIRGASKYPVILLHGASTAAVTTGYDWNLTGWPSLCKLPAILASEGIPCIASGMDGNHYAKPLVTQSGGSGYINKALAYIAAQTGCSASKAHVVGVSMGGGATVPWAARNVAAAASVTGLIPMASIERLYTDNTGSVVTNGFAHGISTAWATAWRSVTDGAMTSGSTTLTSATAVFTSGDVGKQIIRGSTQTNIPVDTTISAFTNSTTVTLDKAATGTVSGYTIAIAGALPMSGDTGADLLGHFAPTLAGNNIPSRFYYASNDPFVSSADVTALATAADGTAIDLGATGHAEASVAAMSNYGGGSDFSEFVDWLKTNGA